MKGRYLLMAEFKPTQKYKTQALYANGKPKFNKKSGEPIYESTTDITKAAKDENGEPLKVDLFKGIEFDEVYDWLVENGTKKQKDDFKKNIKAVITREKLPVIDRKTGLQKLDANGKPKTKDGDIISIDYSEDDDYLNIPYAIRKFVEDVAPKLIEKKEGKSVGVKDKLKNL